MLFVYYITRPILQLAFKFEIDSELFKWIGDDRRKESVGDLAIFKDLSGKIYSGTINGVSEINNRRSYQDNTLFCPNGLTIEIKSEDFKELTPTELENLTDGKHIIYSKLYFPNLAQNTILTTNNMVDLQRNDIYY